MRISQKVKQGLIYAGLSTAAIMGWVEFGVEKYKADETQDTFAKHLVQDSVQHMQDVVDKNFEAYDQIIKKIPQKELQESVEEWNNILDMMSATKDSLLQRQINLASVDTTKLDQEALKKLQDDRTKTLETTESVKINIAKSRIQFRLSYSAISGERAPIEELIKQNKFYEQNGCIKKVEKDIECDHGGLFNNFYHKGKSALYFK